MNYTWSSAFTALRAKEQAAADIENYFNSNTSFKENLDILDLSLEQIKDSFGVGASLVTIDLDISQQVTVKFSDGTAFVFEIILVRDLSHSKSKIKIGLNLKKAIDKQGRFIPLNAIGLGVYGHGEVLTKGNTGDLNAFLAYAASLGEIRIIIDNRSGVHGGRVKITDCKVKSGSDGVEIVCDSENG